MYKKLEKKTLSLGVCYDVQYPTLVEKISIMRMKAMDDFIDQGAKARKDQEFMQPCIQIMFSSIFKDEEINLRDLLGDLGKQQYRCIFSWVESSSTDV